MFSALGTISAAGTLVFVSKESLAATLYILSMLKVAVMAISVFLFFNMRQEREDYFYINIGQHPRKLLGMALCTDAATYITICTLIMIARYVFNW